MYDVYLSHSQTQISLIIASIVGVIAYRLAVFAAFASIMKDSPTTKLDVVGSLITPQFATSVTASCINFVIIMILNFLYERVAIKITDMGESLVYVTPRLNLFHLKRLKHFKCNVSINTITKKYILTYCLLLLVLVLKQFFN